eukprot:scaffold104358_cov105-Cyclotella_meneghiniana.AAC.1
MAIIFEEIFHNKPMRRINHAASFQEECYCENDGKDMTQLTSTPSEVASLGQRTQNCQTCTYPFYRIKN